MAAEDQSLARVASAASAGRRKRARAILFTGIDVQRRPAGTRAELVEVSLVPRQIAAAFFLCSALLAFLKHLLAFGFSLPSSPAQSHPLMLAWVPFGFAFMQVLFAGICYRYPHMGSRLCVTSALMLSGYVLADFWHHTADRDPARQLDHIAEQGIWMLGVLVVVMLITPLRIGQAISLSVFAVTLLVVVRLLMADGHEMSAAQRHFCTALVFYELAIIVLMSGLSAVRHAFLRRVMGLALLHDQVRRDPMTQLLNRDTMRDAIENAMVAGGRSNGPAQDGPGRTPGAPISLMMVDLDHFKRINDEWGHVVGDQVIVAMARLMKAAAGPNDLVGRWGGEEFVLLGRDRTRDQAIELAHDIQRRMSEADWPVEHGVTASIGVTVAEPEDCVKRLLERVDLALYAAKRAGRNRVMSYRACEARSHSA